MTDQARIERFVSEIGRVFHALSINRKETTVAFEQKDNSGAVFVNDRKEQDTHPDRTGTARIDGVDYWVNGWLRETKSGKPYLALSFKRKEEANRKHVSDLRSASPRRDMGDPIPF